jgi:formate dehydrogenase major subunit
MATKANSIFGSDVRLSRRTFTKLTALGTAAALSGINTVSAQPSDLMDKLIGPASAAPAPATNEVKSICSFCSVGCGYIGVVEDDVFTRMEPWEDHPISLGGMCSKGASLANVTNSPRRLKYPMKKEGGKWRKITWDQALDEIASKMVEIRSNDGPDPFYFCGLVHGSNEEAYMFRKFAMLWGTNNVDHQARICHSTTVAGLLATYGHGAMTGTTISVEQTKCAFFFGSNAAEAHPVFMQRIFNARDKGAKIIVADPRFTKTASFSDLYMQFRGGSDIAFIYGIIHEIFANGWEDKEYLQDRTYGWEKLREVVKDYSPEVVEDITWTPAEKIREAARIMVENRPVAVIWSMGATQHSIGTYLIRALAALSLVLGSQGKWGGGCFPIRGHDNVQGVTDMCVLAHFLPGYYGVGSEGSFEWYTKVFEECKKRGLTSGSITFDELKARFDVIKDGPLKDKPQMTNPGFTVSNWFHGVLDKPIAEIDQNVNVKAVFFWGQAASSIKEIEQEKKAFEKLDMLVVVDPFVGAEAACPERSDGVYLLPAATRQEGSGSVTTTGREWQWRDPVLEKPVWDNKPDMWIIQNLAKKIDEKMGKSFMYPFFDYKSIEDVTREINIACRPIGLQGQTPERLKRQKENAHTFDPKTGKANGGPCAGEYWGLPWPSWTTEHPGTPVLYCDEYDPNEGGHDFRARWKYPEDDPQKGEEIVRERWTAPYGSIHWTYDYAKDMSGEVVSQALADGNPPTGRGKARIYVYEQTDKIPVHREPIESPRPDLVEKYPTFPDQEHKYRLCVCEFITEQQRAIQENRHEKYPIVLSTGRQVEHHGGGAQTRNSEILVELQPEVYVEISPRFAGANEIKNGDWVWVESARGRIKVKAKVTERANLDVPPYTVAFIPYHWCGMFKGTPFIDRYPEGTAPLAYGDSVNIIITKGVDQVTQMQETKVTLVTVYKA